MADKVALTAGSGTGGSALTDEVTDAVMGLGQVQFVKLMTGTLDGTDKAVVSANGALAVDQKANALVSTANSTSANLAGAAVFTGTSEDVSEYAGIVVSVFSSHASATDGLSMQQSIDGTNWDHTDVYSIPAATGRTYSMAVAAKFFRLVYTNGATLTTSLRIQTIYSKAAKKGSSVRPQDARSNDNDVEEVAAFGYGYNGATWDRLRATTVNGLAVDVTRAPAITKGTQGTTGFTVQDLKDAGRSHIALSWEVVAGTAAAESALTNFTLGYRGGAALAAANNLTVTAGKTLRLTSMVVTFLENATAAIGRVRIRHAATVANTSPVAFSMVIGSPAGTAAAKQGHTVTIPFPDGIEIPAGQQVTVTWFSDVNTCTFSISLVGFEY